MWRICFVCCGCCFLTNFSAVLINLPGWILILGFYFLSRFTVTASQNVGIFPFLVPRNNVNASTKVKVLRIVKMWKRKKSCFNRVYFRETCAIGHRLESLLLFLQLDSQPAGSLCTDAPVFLFHIFCRFAFIRFFGFPAALCMRCF